MEKHSNLPELVADLRNKFGAIVNYFSLIEYLEKETDKEKIEKLNKILKENEKTSIRSIKDIRNLLHQFGNFDL
jgi:bacterioferritin (cytochrome b1)